MNAFPLGLIFSVLTTLTLSAFVLSLPRRQKMHWYFVFYLLSIGWWASFSAVQTLSANPRVVEIAVRVMHWGALFISVFFLHFLFFFTHKIGKKLLWGCYAVALAFLVLNHTPYFISGIEPKPPFHYFMKAGPLYHYYVVFFIATWSYAVWVLFKTMQTESGVKRKQLKLLLVGSLIGYIGGSGAFIPVYNFKIPILYPYGNFAIAIYVSIMTYAIVRHRFLDIEILVRKTVVFAGLSTFVFGVFSAATVIVREVLSHYFQTGHSWTYTISLFLIILGYDPINTFSRKNTTTRNCSKKRRGACRGSRAWIIC